MNYLQQEIRTAFVKAGYVEMSEPAVDPTDGAVNLVLENPQGSTLDLTVALNGELVGFVGTSCDTGNECDMIEEDTTVTSFSDGETLQNFVDWYLGW